MRRHKFVPVSSAFSAAAAFAAFSAAVSSAFLPTLTYLPRPNLRATFNGK